MRLALALDRFFACLLLLRLLQEGITCGSHCRVTKIFGARRVSLGSPKCVAGEIREDEKCLLQQEKKGERKVFSVDLFSCFKQEWAFLNVSFLCVVVVDLSDVQR